MAKNDRTVPELRRHAAFFDGRGTGMVTLADTRDGLRRLGVGRVQRCALALLINFALGRLTQRRFTFTIDVNQIARGTHSHDTQAFGRDDGVFSKVAFDQLFAEAASGRDHITEDEMVAYLKRNISGRTDSGPAGVVFVFSKLETRVLFRLAQDRSKHAPKPMIRKRRLRRFYDGTLFYAIERAVRIREKRA